MEKCYLEVEALQDTLKSSSFSGIDDYELAIEAASRWIDDRCSDPCCNIIRHFWRDDTPTVRLYHADSPQLVRTGDFADTTDMLVEIRQADGTWAELDADLWQPEPLVLLNDDPYTRITATEYGTTFPQSLKPMVRITNRWGFVGVPKPVRQACQIMAVAFMLGTSVISDENGYSLGAAGPADPTMLADSLLDRYLPPGKRNPLLTGKR